MGDTDRSPTARPSPIGWTNGRRHLDPLSCAVLDGASGAAIGIVTLMDFRPSMRVIEIGHIVYSPALQRTRAATEVQYLMARHVFEDARLPALRMEVRTR